MIAADALEDHGNGVAGDSVPDPRREGSTNPEELPEHLLRGREGEEAAYFYLRAQGYVMVARNYRSRDIGERST